MRMTGSATVKYVKERRDVPRYFEHESSKLPFGSGEWWRAGGARAFRTPSLMLATQWGPKLGLRVLASLQGQRKDGA
jgi:hypothetical protein